MSGIDPLPIVVQVLLGLAVFSFLEYSIRTAHASDVANRRARLVCAAGLTLGVLGFWVLLFHELAGMIMTISGNLVAVGAMIWLERYAPRIMKGGAKSGADEETSTGAEPTEVDPGAVEAGISGASPGDLGPEMPEPGIPDIGMPDPGPPGTGPSTSSFRELP